MVPIGHQPILWHVMNYYSQYGHREFVLCLGYKANVIRDYFLTVKRWTYSDVEISDFGKKVEVLGEAPLLAFGETLPPCGQDPARHGCIRSRICRATGVKSSWPVVWTKTSSSDRDC